MSVNVSLPTEPELKPRITVVGVGGAGGNAINNMIQANLSGVEFVVANTDAQALTQSLCDRRIQLGINITQGLGAGARPDIGRAAAEEVMDEVLEHLKGSNMVFIAAGMGGGTGTGAASVIARVAREQGILTVGVVTKPFHFEGTHRMRLAEAGLEDLQQYVDTLIVIPNQNLFRIATEHTTFGDAFKMADDVLYSGVRGVTDLMVQPGLVNLDFADIRSVMSEMGKAMMGTGEADGDRRAIDAAEAAISNPLLDDVSMRGARGVLISITGGSDITLFEVDEAANRIREEVDPEANIIFGSTFDDNMQGRIRVSVVATGIETVASSLPQPERSSVSQQVGRATASLAPLTSGQQAPVKPQLSPNASYAPISTHRQQPQAAPQAAEASVAPQPSPVQPAPQVQSAPAATPSPAASVTPKMTQAKTTSSVAISEGSPTGPVTEAAVAETVMKLEEPIDTPLSHPVAQAASMQANTAPQAKVPSLFERVTGSAAPRQAQENLSRAVAVGGKTAAPSAAAPKSNEDDLLDIPAFLRRQSN